ncbi:glycoside hydrolase family 18 protein [Jaminaea rosea]|uniref:Glycoside hydrolase family 18 protein n=1 Tax=Jaminaea rosea TaxID=1569628 RepID=A0A316V319_9BASI|nr:glycoside hydrolase family 18 protein [Jaminaea rosea]PWN30583.1 glycoside hydrolase family 18 protein [Jaminaea rosea]
MGGYWPEWVSGTLPPEKIDWTKYSYMAYAFAVPNSDGTVSLSDSSGTMLKRLIKAGHAANSKILLSIGGWGQSNGFSPSAASDTMRAKFVKSVLSLYNTYGIDGIDLDWEYPNNAAAGTYSPQDTANFQTLLQALRAGLPQKAIITAAVAQAPWLASNGQSVASVARAAGALDYIMIMNYDVWGSSSSPGPNAPLANLCGNSTQPGASAAAAVKQWAAAGMPKNKMILGSPFYGYVSTSSKTKLVTRDMDTAADRRALTSGDGQVNFASLVSQGVLSLSGSEFIAGSGFTKYWDDCSDTPYLANGNKVITYDDPDSLYDKGAFVQQAGLGGSAVWSVDGDVASGALIKALRKGMGMS